MTTTATRPEAARTESTMNMVGLVFGMAFGGLLAGGLLHEYSTIHDTLMLRNPYVFLVMGSAIAVAAPLLWFLENRHANTALAGALKLSQSKPERHHITGGMMFGAGWAIAGTCPAPALVMFSSGAWLGLIAIAGIFIGLYIREAQNRAPAAAGDGEHRTIVPNVARFGK